MSHRNRAATACTPSIAALLARSLQGDAASDAAALRPMIHKIFWRLLDIDVLLGLVRPARVNAQSLFLQNVVFLQPLRSNEQPLHVVFDASGFNMRLLDLARPRGHRWREFAIPHPMTDEKESPRSSMS